MADQHPIQGFTAADIERYHKNLMTMQERHALEKAALDDPMLADAIEGYALINDVSAQNEIADLRLKLEARIHRDEQKKRGGFMQQQWFRVAAMLLLLAGAGTGIYFLSQQSTQNNIATTSPAEMQTKKEDTAVNGNDTAQTKTVTGTAPAPTNEVAIAETSKKTVKTNHHATLKTSNTIVTDTVQMQAAAAQQSALARKEETLKTEAFNQQQQAATMAMKATERRARSNVFRGQVTDKYNQPLPFANVSNTADNIGTYADAKGFFTLVSEDSMLKVRVKSVGYENDTIQLQAIAGINKVTLAEDNSVATDRIAGKKSAVAKKSHITFQDPEPEDGWAYYDIYIANNLQVPEEIKTKPSSGEVELSFEIDQNGEPVGIQVEKSLCPACDQEAIRLIKQGPKWKKGKTKRVKIFVGY